VTFSYSVSSDQDGEVSKLDIAPLYAPEALETEPVQEWTGWHLVWSQFRPLTTGGFQVGL